MSAPFKFDEIGYWSELKLEIIEKYGAAYVKAFSRTKGLKKYYIDAFSGAGTHLSKETGKEIEGSPTRALKISPPFDVYYFIDADKRKADFLQKTYGDKPNVNIYNGDSNEFLAKELLPKIQYKNFNRALCLLDPYGLHLDWQVMCVAGQSQAIDMFLNFPVMDMNRNTFWKNPKGVALEDIERMNRFWGDESWRTVAYAESPPNLFGDVDLIKQSNEQISEAFRVRLMQAAGFKYVADPLPMKNSKGAVVYYLMFASQKPVAEKIIKDIYKKYQ